jgi:hypothetical protein
MNTLKSTLFPHTSKEQLSHKIIRLDKRLTSLFRPKITPEYETPAANASNGQKWLDDMNSISQELYENKNHI